MRSANEAYIGQAQFSEANDLFQKALGEGLESNELQSYSYLRISACLLKMGKKASAEKFFVEAWALNQEMDLDFGDQETRDFHSELEKNYTEKYPTVSP